MGKNKKFKALRAAAKKLPTFIKDTKVRVTGQDLLDKNPDAKDSTGNPIYYKEIYLVTAPQKVNHYRAMKKAMSKEGMKGAVDYFKQSVAIAKSKSKQNASV